MIHPRPEIAAAISAKLDQEARRNEYRVSLVRFWAYMVVVLLDLALAFRGVREWQTLTASAGLVAMSALLLWLTRHRYQAWYRFAFPALDAVGLTIIVQSRLELMGASLELASVTSIACALFASTGGLRFNRWSAAWTTVLAGAVLWVCFGAYFDFARMLYCMNGILAVGFIALWMSDLVRRSMENARGRSLLLRFLPSGLVKQAYDDPLALLAEPREVQASVLVSDLRGFTAVASRMKPSEVLAMLNELQGALAEAVQQNGGVVDKFMGDGMLAVFGAPEEVKDHAARALAAAAAIRTAVANLNRAHPGRQALRIGVGIHSGSLVAGCLGGGDRLEFTVIGDTVNMASRLEALTKEQGVDVLVSDDTARAAGATLRPLGEVSVRGRSEPIRVHTLMEAAA